jgi:hypothetical protein
MDIPKAIVVQYFYQYSGYPEYNRSNGVYVGCCPICREGKSWGKKKRLFFLPKENHFFCHNCQISWKPLEWICQVSGKPYFEVLQEAQEEGFLDDIEFSNNYSENKKDKTDYPLPFSSINLFNNQEIKYYSNNKIVKDAIKLIKDRRLHTAINKVNLYISLKDFIYKNRICIPFKGTDGKILFYQCRALYKKDEDNGRKYISKYGSDKSVFNIEKIDIDYPHIFLFEGPLDSMFVKNGVGVAGLTFTEFQSSQLNKFLTHNKIWVLDNQRVDDDAMKKSLSLVKKGENVFVWPKEFKKYKDLNNVCVDLKKDCISPDFFIKRSVNNETMFMAEFI